MTDSKNGVQSEYQFEDQCPVECRSHCSGIESQCPSLELFCFICGPPRPLMFLRPEFCGHMPRQRRLFPILFSLQRALPIASSGCSKFSSGALSVVRPADICPPPQGLNPSRASRGNFQTLGFRPESVLSVLCKKSVSHEVGAAERSHFSGT